MEWPYHVGCELYDMMPWQPEAKSRTVSRLVSSFPFPTRLTSRLYPSTRMAIHHEPRAGVSQTEASLGKPGIAVVICSKYYIISVAPLSLLCDVNPVIFSIAQTETPYPLFTMAANPDQILENVNILGELNDKTRQILNKDAVVFLALLHRTFNQRRKELLQRRVTRQAELDKGNLPDFLPETKHIREDPSWKGAPPAPGLADRRVEITGPTDRKMVVNALNSDVWTYMADFEGT